MLATVINSLALQDALERESVIARVMSALQIHDVARILSAVGLFGTWKKAELLFSQQAWGHHSLRLTRRKFARYRDWRRRLG